jgi:uncharacterized protein YggE
MSAHTRYVVIIIGLLTALAVGGAAGVFLSPKAAVNAPRSNLSAVTLSSATPSPTPATVVVSPSGTITVVGLGTATAIPDEATLGLGVSATRPTVRDAVNAASADMTRLLSALKAQGVQAKDMQTNSISIFQQTSCCPTSVTSYTASNLMTVTIHHINNVNAVIETSVEKVGNEIQLNGVNLIVSDPTAMTSAARAAAMSDATARAQNWAKLSNHRVGALVGLSEIVASPSGPVCGQACGGAGGGGGAFQIQPGQSSVTLTITATYELLS